MRTPRTTACQSVLWRALSVAVGVAVASCGATDRAPVDTGDGAEDVDTTSPDAVEDTADSIAATDSGAADTTASPDVADTGTTPGDAVIDPDAADAGPDTLIDTSDVGDACPVDTLCNPGFSVPTCSEGRCNLEGDCVASPIAGCCTADADCPVRAGLPACSRPRCVAMRCVEADIPGCCTDHATCDDQFGASTDVCGADTGLCQHCTIGFCDGSAGVFGADFEVPTLLSAGFVLTDSLFSDDVRWQISPHRSVNGERSAYLGDLRCRTYYNGALDGACVPVDPFAQDARRVLATLTTPPITLAAAPANGGGDVATVWVWSDVEATLTGGPGEPDVLRVAVVPTATDAPTWRVGSTLAIGKSTQAGWRLLSVDLTPWRGQTVRLQFSFDTFDGRDNQHEGIYLDDLRVTRRCAARGCCESDEDCGHLALDTCEVARCVSLTNGAANICVVAPADAPGAVCEACTAGDDATCDDGNPCTHDRCGPEARCVHDMFCCFRRTHFEASFELGLNRWTPDDTTPDDSVMWRTSTAFQSDGLAAAWFGDPISGTYATGQPVAGTITSLPISLPEERAVERGLDLVFTLWLETEWDGVSYDNPTGLDRLSVELRSLGVSGAPATEVWSSDAIGGTTLGAPLQITVPIDAFFGQAVQLRIGFRSGDGDANGFAGPFIDDIKIQTRCTGR